MSDEFHDWDDILLCIKLRLSPSNKQLNFSTFLKLRRSYFLCKITIQSTNKNSEPMNHNARWGFLICICFSFFFNLSSFAFIIWLVWLLPFICLGSKGKDLNLAFHCYLKWSIEINICERLKMPKRQKYYHFPIFSLKQLIEQAFEAPSYNKHRNL